MNTVSGKENQVVHELRVMGYDGDHRLVWDTEDVASVQLAEEFFNKALSVSGRMAFSVQEGKPNEVVEKFDPLATRIVVIPAMAGG